MAGPRDRKSSPRWVGALSPLEAACGAEWEQTPLAFFKYTVAAAGAKLLRGDAYWYERAQLRILQQPDLI